MSAVSGFAAFVQRVPCLRFASMLTKREHGTHGVAIPRQSRGLILLAIALLIAGVAKAEDSLRVREERAMKEALAKIGPSVVRVETVGGLERLGEMLVGTGPTTGLIVSSDGYIVSSAFNFAQKPDSILVTLPDGSRQAARLVATDHSRLLVLLKVDTEQELALPEAVPEKDVRVGQWALAVGRTFELAQPNLSVGIVSAVDRIWGKAIQTDAKISPSNYGGPLVDISGRVLGVLVPMSPQGAGDLAGVEWYDSGIGFAVPLEIVFRMLPRFKEGDLHPGVLGITLKGSDLYNEAPVIGAARPAGPAYKAGFRAGDKIVSVGDREIVRQAQLKHELGPLYSGERVRLVALRGDQRIDREVELADKIEPYAAPFLGILPMRSGEGLIVRYVYAESPAAKAGVQAGDRITQFAGEKIEHAAGLREKLQQLSPGESVAIEVRRGEATLPIRLELATLPETLPGDLPPAYDGQPAEEGEKPQAGVVQVKLPEAANTCQAYVPDGVSAANPAGVIVWLAAPGGAKWDDRFAVWKPLCDQYGFILMAPEPGDAARWQPTEAGTIRDLLAQLTKTYAVDPERVVVHGHQGGGSMAYLLALVNRETFRAAAVVDAPLPRVSQLPETDPMHALAFYTALATKSEQTKAIAAGVDRLRGQKFPVVVKEIGEQARDLTAEELAELVRWFDTLDRM